ncbi:MAG: 2-hydroxychromene-2-carboxylate isomerase [Betaproteobacteria bacterium]
MGKQVECYFDFGSAYSALAYWQLPKVAAACNAEIVWRPMLLGGVFKATGNSSPADVAAKGRWSRIDLQRWAQRYAVKFVMTPHFPINTLVLMRGAVGVQMYGYDFARYANAMFSAIWREQRNLNDPAVVAAVLHEAGFDPEAFARMMNEQTVKYELKRVTEAAVARGVFGAPTFFVGEEMFWGQDRLDFVGEALEKT